MEELKECPVCKQTVFIPYLKCLDLNISKEEFNLVQCKSCQFVFTNPRPSEAEIGPYYSSEAYISHHADKRGLMPYLYRKIRGIQFDNKAQIIRNHIANPKSVLDIGCGTGDFLHYCNSLGWKTTGVEPDTEARKTAQLKNLDIHEQDYLDSCTQQFDVITMWHVLEHVHALDQRMAQLKRLILPGGIIIIAVPNLNSFDAKYYHSFWAAYDVPRHLYHFSRATISLLFSNYSLKLAETVPMVYDAFYVSMKSEEYQNGKAYSYTKGPTIGLLSHISALKTGEFSSLIYVFKP